MKLATQKTIWLMYDLEDSSNSIWWFATREQARKFKKSFDKKYQNLLSVPIKFVKPETQEITHGPNLKINIPVLTEVVEYARRV